MEIVILGAGPSLSSDLDALPLWAEQFLIATTPMSISKINADLYVRELPSESKFASYPKKEQIFSQLIAEHYEKIPKDKVLQFDTDSFSIETDNALFRNKNITLVYGSKFQALVYLKVLLIFVVNLFLPLRHRRLFLMRSSITVLLCMAIFIFKAKKINVVGYNPSAPGYFYEKNSSLLKPNIDETKLLAAKDAVHIRRSPDQLATILKAFIIFGSMLGVKIQINL